MKKSILVFLLVFYTYNVYGSVFYTNNRNDARVLKVDTTTGVVSVFLDGAVDGLMNNSVGLALSNDNSILYVTASNGKIFQYDTSTGIGTELVSGLTLPHAIAFDQTGYVYVSHPVTKTIAKISPDGTSVTTFISGGYLTEPAGLLFDNYGNLYVANGTGGNILKYDSNGTYIDTFASTGLLRPGILYLDQDDNLYVADRLARKVNKYDLSGNLLLQITTGLHDPLGMGHDSEGNLYVADRTNNYIAIFDPYGVFIGTVTDPLFKAPGFIVFENSFSNDIIPEPLTCISMGTGLMFIARRLVRQKLF